MVLMLDEDESFSMQAYVTSPGYQSTVLRGFITQQRADGLYAAPLLPQLFYGASGSALSTWRQYLPTSGSQTILSRSGGLPTLPREQLYWRKIRDTAPARTTIQPAPQRTAINPMLILIPVLLGGLIYYMMRK